MHGYLKHVEHPDAPVVNKLYRARQNELAKFFACDAAARGAAVAGASIVVFVGPAGLLMLVPSMLGIIVTTCFTRRMVRVDDAMTPHEKMSLDTDTKYIESIVASHQGVRVLDRLRQLRHQRYPRGWGTRWRPLLRIYRRLRYDTHAQADVQRQRVGGLRTRRQTHPRGARTRAAAGAWCTRRGAGACTIC